MITLINNRFATNPKLPLTPSLLRGFGVFETLRTYDDRQLPLAKMHLKRLFQSAKSIGLKINYKQSEVLKMLEKVTKKSSHKLQRIKIVAVEGQLIIFSEKAKINHSIYQGVKLKSVIMDRSLPEIKSISYLPSLIAHQEATKAGAYDALLINEKCEVFEGAHCNIFWFEGNTLCTRPDKVLPGITREIILKNSPFKVKLKSITLKKLQSTKEVFLTQSINLIVPVTQIDNKQIGTGEPGPNTQQIMGEWPY